MRVRQTPSWFLPNTNPPTALRCLWVQPQSECLFWRNWRWEIHFRTSSTELCFLTPKVERMHPTSTSLALRSNKVPPRLTATNRVKFLQVCNLTVPWAASIWKLILKAKILLLWLKSWVMERQIEERINTKLRNKTRWLLHGRVSPWLNSLQARINQRQRVKTRLWFLQVPPSKMEKCAWNFLEAILSSPRFFARKRTLNLKNRQRSQKNRLRKTSLERYFQAKRRQRLTEFFKSQ